MVACLLAADTSWGQPLVPPPGENHSLYIVRLAAPGAVERLRDLPSRGVSLLRAPGGRQELLRAAATVEAAQDRWIDEYLTDPELQVVGRATVVGNQLFVRAPSEKVAQLAALPGVAGVFPAAERRLLLDSAPQQMHIDALWSVLGGTFQSGTGVKIGILDTGIQLSHPMFRDTSMSTPAGYPRGDTRFTNHKVIVARSFPDLFPFPPLNGEDRTPEDQDGHGTAVAAIAAGSQALSPQAGVIHGIAPRAWIGNYKIFGTGANSTTTTAAVIAAIDQAVADGMDVINLSLGGTPPQDPNDPELEAVRNAVAAGVVVVAAAGNEGPLSSTITSPAIAPEAIAVGAVTHGRKFAAVLRVEAPGLLPELAEIGYLPGANVSLPNGFGPFPLRSLTAYDASRLACSPLPAGVLSGTVALVRRGECFFQEKLINVRAAGALGMIVYNNIDGPEVIMALDDAAIPAVFIARRPGEALQDLADSLPPAGVLVRMEPDTQLQKFPAVGDQIADFSSRGPGYDGAVKPDLVAVGSAVLSADFPQGFTYALNGTSFAAPMVAGAAALLRQLHPDWTPTQIKSALLTTAAAVVTREDGSPADIYEAGAGRLDLEKIAAVQVAVEPATLNFFPRAGENAGPQHLQVTNLTPRNVTLRVEFEARRGDPGVTVFADPDRLTLAPQTTQPLEAHCAAAPGTPGGEAEGGLLLMDESTGVALRVAVRCLVLGAGPRRTLQVSRSGAVVGAFETIRSALTVARPGDVIEILDEGPYLETVRIEKSSSGLDLDGLVIRGVAPQPTVLDGSGASGEVPVIDVVGATGVRLENLRIRGGGIGIRFTEGASGVVENCHVSSRRLGFFAHGIWIRERSRAVVLDTVVDDGGGSGISVRDFNSQALVIDSRVGDQSGARPVEYHGVHVHDSATAVLMGNTIFAGGAGREQHGALVESGSLYLLQGNRLARAAGPGNGVYLKRGNTESLATVFEGHRGSGLQADPFTGFTLDFDLFRDNATSGLSLNSSTGQVSHATFQNNGVGVQLGPGALTLTNSLITSSTRQGILAGGTQNLTLEYVTVAGNGAEGLLGTNLQTGTMTGAIFYGNGGRDVSVTGSLLTGYSLVGQAQGLTPLSGSTLLYARDPRFASAVGGNYTLLPDSPAIDLVRSFSLLDPIDLAGHLRNADGDHDGTAFPDAGAFETESPFAPPLAAPHASRNGWFTGLAFTNSWVRDDGTTSKFQIEVRGYAPDGTRLGASSLQVTEETQTAKLLGELLPGAAPAWVEVLAEHPYVKGFVLQGDQELQRLDGAALEPPWSMEIHFMGLGEGEASRRLLVINPSAKPVAITIVEHPSPSGQSRFETLPPFGTLELAATDLSPETEFVTVFSQDASRLAGFTELETEESFAVLPALSEKEFGFELYGAQLAVTPALRSRLELISPVADTTATIEALDDDGNVVAQHNVGLAGGRLYAADLGAALGLTNFVGWLRVRTADPPRKVAGAVVFGAADGRYLAALPLQAWPSGGRVSVFSHVAQGDGLFTGITLLNPGVDPALYALEIYDPAGNLVGRASGELCAGCKRARVLPEWVPDLDSQWGGWVRLRSSQPLLGFELFGNGEYLAAVPQQVVVP